MRNFLKHAIQFMCQPVRLSFLKGPSQAAAKPVQVRVRQISGDSSKTPFPKTPFTETDKRNLQKEINRYQLIKRSSQNEEFINRRRLELVDYLLTTLKEK